MSNLEFCERSVWGVLQQPANTLSACAFFGTAAFVWKAGGHHAWTMALLGLCTAAMHATGAPWAGIADLASMFLCVTYSLCKNCGFAERAAVPAAAACSLLSVASVHVRGLAVFTAVAAAWLLSYIPVLSLRVVCGYAVFSVAFLAWFVDRQESACDPYSPWQWHALWHVGSAVGFALLLPCGHAEGARSSEAWKLPALSGMGNAAWTLRRTRS